MLDVASGHGPDESIDLPNFIHWVGRRQRWRSGYSLVRGLFAIRERGRCRIIAFLIDDDEERAFRRLRQARARPEPASIQRHQNHPQVARKSRR